MIVSHWHCPDCDVGGRDPERQPACWSCGGGVVVTSRPTVDPDEAGP